MTAPAVAGMPRLLLRLEGLALFVLGTWFFAQTEQSWVLFAVLFFSPDLSFAGYMAGPKAGAAIYNAAHTTLGPALLTGIGLALNASLLLGLAAIWAAHIGFDRMVGYGLKYETAFNDTHLGRIGRNKAEA
ncbi:DUF4260 domain-containing protein [Microvirga sp. ACRRW]|uniref:DUF4260 domain-containing protein n=1 Tax=Microvirga sp. ACRRW TaxID=2918205 RepID=UPI001EF54084|nr:DUF4260 domain-containing protein [Microvirga sp. ACRRW]MCG7392105.1 DUF4260 domain-containing protein [Microvirga sp. ACRRW]